MEELFFVFIHVDMQTSSRKTGYNAFEIEPRYFFLQVSIVPRNPGVGISFPRSLGTEDASRPVLSPKTAGKA